MWILSQLGYEGVERPLGRLGRLTQKRTSKKCSTSSQNQVRALATNRRVPAAQPGDGERVLVLLPVPRLLREELAHPAVGVWREEANEGVNAVFQAKFHGVILKGVINMPDAL